MERLLRYSAIALVVVMVGTLSYGLGLSRNATILAPAGAQSAVAANGSGQFAILEEAFQLLRRQYVDPNAIEYEPLRNGALQGLLQALGDRELVYITPERYRLDRNSFEGSFQGIGATVASEQGRITIVAPIRDSPAERAGIRPGDVILQIDGESAEGMPLAEAVAKIRGPRGTTVRLTLVRAGDTRPYSVDIVRDEIRTESVFVRQVPGNPDMAHVIITQFTNRTNQEISQALTELRRQNTKGIILDLRNNPGGLLKETIDVTSEFLKGGVPILKEIGRNGNERIWNDSGNDLAADIPLVVLVNQGSASGSEVLAGALQDYNRATIIGTQTYGKGTVNQVHELSDGGALYIPIARWYTPRNRQIEGIGLKPDIEVPLTEEDIRAQNDVQFQRATQVLRSKIQ